MTTEVSDASWPVLMAENVNTLTQRIEDAFRNIRDLHAINRKQSEEIQSLRQQLGTLNTQVGFEFEGSRVIPRATASKLLHRTSRTLLRWESEGLLEPLHIKSQVYYRLQQVEGLFPPQPS